MEASVRPAGSHDAARLSELATAAYAELSSERGGEQIADGRTAVSGDRLEARLARNEAAGFLGELDAVTVGAAIVSLGSSGIGPVGVLEVLYVEPEARELGVGEALIRAAARWSREHGASGIDVAALPGTRAAKSFLEEMGFRARLLVMHRRLDEDDLD